jgi:carbon-monoxide dehydrogenase medium subunit
MIPGPFAYHRPTSVKDAVGLLGSLGDDARAIAGGHSLIPLMKLRLASPAHLIDLPALPISRAFAKTVATSSLGQ